MKYRLMLPLVGFVAGLAQDAGAVSTIDKSQSVAAARSDAGSGLCGTFVHFMPPQVPLATPADAVTLFNKPANDPQFLGRVARVVGNINYRNAQATASGDFQPPTYTRDLFPFSNDAQANPKDNDANFAARLRGYLNIPQGLAGKTLDFALNCDDGCSLKIGTTMVIARVDERISARVIKQVSFSEAGLYPVELIHFQNGGQAYLEWSRSDTAVPECMNDVCTVSLTDQATYMGQFKLVAAADLYSSIVGSNTACQECGAAGMAACSSANYCADGLCQACVTADHCGSDCVKCTGSATMCVAGKCAQCMTDAQCMGGATCNTATGMCNPPIQATGGCSMGSARGSASAGMGLLVAVLGMLGLGQRRRSARASRRAG